LPVFGGILAPGHGVRLTPSGHCCWLVALLLSWLLVLDTADRTLGAPGAGVSGAGVWENLPSLCCGLVVPGGSRGCRAVSGRI